jgi:hypothetical protein
MVDGVYLTVTGMTLKKPAGDGLAMDTKLRGDINASGCLLTSEEHQHLQSLLVVGITFFAVEFLEGLIILLDDRAGSVAHCSFLPNLSLWWDVAKNWYEKSSDTVPGTRSPRRYRSSR